MKKQFLAGSGIGVVIVAVVTGVFILFNKIGVEKETEVISSPVSETEFGYLFPDGRYFDLREYKEILVDAGDNYFQPPHIVINAGTKVIWQNKGNLGHYIYSDDNPTLNALLPQKGSVFEKVFSEPGSHPYYCRNHPEEMRGLIVVVAN